jgi:hypothetical protein
MGIIMMGFQAMAPNTTGSLILKIPGDEVAVPIA